MIKKILFFGIAIILGFMVLIMSYSGFQMSDVQAKITEYMNNGEYDNLDKCFLPYYDSNSIKPISENDHFTLVGLESIHGVSATVTVDGEEQTASKYVASYTFFIKDFNNFDFEGISGEDTYHNYTRLVFKNGDLSFDYYFNVPDTATTSDTEGVERYYTQYAQSMDFVEIDIPLSDIEDDLNGEIKSIEVYDSKAIPGQKEPVEIINLENPLTTNSEFFTLANELVSNWDKYLNDLDSEAFNNFFDPEDGEGWIDRYNANPGFSRGINSYEDLIGSSAIVKTVIVMIVYLVVCVLLGFLLLRNKNKLPKPYLRDKYQKQMVSANSIKQEVKEAPVSVGSINIDKENEADNGNKEINTANIEEVNNEVENKTEVINEDENKTEVINEDENNKETDIVTKEDSNGSNDIIDEKK